VSDTSKSALLLLITIVNDQYHFMTFDWFPVPVRSAVKSDLTVWCCQNLSNHALTHWPLRYFYCATLARGHYSTSSYFMEGANSVTSNIAPRAQNSGVL